MKNLIPLFFLVFLFQFLHTSEVQAEIVRIPFPEILSWKNSPHIELEQKKIAQITKNHLLKNPFLVTTGIHDEVVLQFSEGEKVTVMPLSKISVPHVSPDTGRANEIEILDGQIRFQSGALTKKRLRLKSVFFDLVIPPETDVLIAVDVSQPLAKFQMLQGEMTVLFFDFEKTQEIKSGESVAFSGERDGEGIKYDFLLNSRKSPHGVLHSVEKFDFSAYTEKEKYERQVKENQANQKIKDEKLSLKKKKEYEQSFLCHQPYGQKNQCHWEKQSETCIRTRCNVSGEWGDETARPLTFCITNAVQACDY